MKISSSLICLSLVVSMTACLKARAPEKASNRTIGGTSSAFDQEGILGTPLDDKELNYRFEEENLKQLLGVNEIYGTEDEEGESKDGEDETKDGDGDDQAEECESTKEGCDEEEVVEVVEACKWNNPEDIDFRDSVSGLPEALKISIKKEFVDKGLGRFEGQFGDRDYIVSFSLFHNNRDIDQSSIIQLNDIKGLWASYYTLIVKDYDSASCMAVGGGNLDNRRDRGGCFAMGTMIKMADGSEKPVGIIKVGDKVRNPVTGKTVEVAEVTSGPEADKSMYRVGYGSKSVVVTEGHPFSTPIGIKAAKHLVKGDKLLTENGFVELGTIEKLKLNPTQVVKNISLKAGKNPMDHMLEADGIVTGDLYLQRSINKSLNALK